MRRTKGKGVDVVLNSLAEDKLRASVRCLAKYGHFVEIGKYDLIKNNPLGDWLSMFNSRPTRPNANIALNFLEMRYLISDMGAFLKAISFHSVQLDDFASAPNEIQQTFRKTVQDMLDSGVIKPINRTIFGIDEVETAIR